MRPSTRKSGISWRNVRICSVTPTRRQNRQWQQWNKVGDVNMLRIAKEWRRIPATICACAPAGLTCVRQCDGEMATNEPSSSKTPRQTTQERRHFIPQWKREYPWVFWMTVALCSAGTVSKRANITLLLPGAVSLRKTLFKGIQLWLITAVLWWLKVADGTCSEP